MDRKNRTKERREHLRYSGTAVSTTSMYPLMLCLYCYCCKSVPSSVQSTAVAYSGGAVLLLLLCYGHVYCCTREAYYLPCCTYTYRRHVNVVCTGG